MTVRPMWTFVMAFAYVEHVDDLHVRCVGGHGDGHLCGRGR
jgi:hypothetical protein